VNDPVHRAVLERLRELGVSTPMPERTKSTGGPLEGSSFCVTGVLSRSREEVHASIEAHGGTVHSAVKKGTTYLVVGEKVGQSKLTQAAKFQTRVITEKDLESLLRGQALPPL
jgi:DNA ligase (NAD+)